MIKKAFSFKGKKSRGAYGLDFFSFAILSIYALIILSPVYYIKTYQDYLKKQALFEKAVRLSHHDGAKCVAELDKLHSMAPSFRHSLSLLKSCQRKKAAREWYDNAIRFLEQKKYALCVAELDKLQKVITPYLDSQPLLIHCQNAMESAKPAPPQGQGLKTSASMIWI